jgi:hypothetical protein
LHEESLLLGRDLGASELLATGLEALMWAAAERGQPHRAAHLGGAAEALREVLGVPLPADGRTGHEQALAALRAALGGESAATAWAAGRALALEDAITLALESSSPDQ